MLAVPTFDLCPRHHVMPQPAVPAERRDRLENVDQDADPLLARRHVRPRCMDDGGYCRAKGTHITKPTGHAVKSELGSDGVERVSCGRLPKCGWVTRKAGTHRQRNELGKLDSQELGSCDLPASSSQGHRIEHRQPDSHPLWSWPQESRTQSSSSLLATIWVVGNRRWCSHRLTHRCSGPLCICFHPCPSCRPCFQWNWSSPRWPQSHLLHPCLRCCQWSLGWWPSCLLLHCSWCPCFLQGYQSHPQSQSCLRERRHKCSHLAHQCHRCPNQEWSDRRCPRETSDRTRRCTPGTQSQLRQGLQHQLAS